MDNHAPFVNTLKYIKSVELRGYQMFSHGDYPYAVRSAGDDTIIAELFEITDPKTEEMICRMEFDADYILSTVQFDNTIFGIFLFENTVPGHERVVHGDWCKYRGEVAF